MITCETEGSSGLKTLRSFIRPPRSYQLLACRFVAATDRPGRETVLCAATVTILSMLLVCDCIPTDGPAYFTDALTDPAPDGREGAVHSIPADGLPALSDIGAVVPTRNAVGVYETDRRP